MAHRRATVAIVLLAGCACPVQSSARVSKHRSADIRAALRKAVTRHPGVITQPWFLRKAGLVQVQAPGDPARAHRPRSDGDGRPRSLAGLAHPRTGRVARGRRPLQRLVDGGALGDVGIEFRQSDTTFLRTSSIPLLWNSDVSGQAQPQGCGDFAGGVDAIDGLKSGDRAGDDDWLGAEPAAVPERRGARRLRAATGRAGHRAADQCAAVAGGRPRDRPSGGHANLFGNIPGRNVSVDVTLSLKTAINAIMRVVDGDAGAFECRQL